MKQYTSNSSHITLKAYKQNHKFCIKVELENGIVIVFQYPTKEQANKCFSAYKDTYKDLVLVK